MSGRMRIRADHGVPAMAVEVVSPDFRVVRRVMLAPGRAEEVDVPSEASFLRAHLPSGEIVILQDVGNLDRLVTLEALTAASQSGERKARPPLAPPAIALSEGPLDEVELPLGVGGAHGRARLLDADGDALPGRRRQDVAEWILDGPSFQRQRFLSVVREGGERVELKVPGNATGLWLRTESRPRERTVHYRVRLQTAEPVADTILNYMARGEFAAAEAMQEWAEQSESFLASKMSDPYAASVGAYLLLNHRDFARLHNWPRNLADSFPFLPDGCVIWAWQLLLSRQGDRDEVERYLFEAARRGMPIYHMGTLLLLDGLNQLGENGREVGRAVKRRMGVVVRESPLTLCVVEAPDAEPAALPATFDVAFGGPED